MQLSQLNLAPDRPVAPKMAIASLAFSSVIAVAGLVYYTQAPKQTLAYEAQGGAIREGIGASSVNGGVQVIPDRRLMRALWSGALATLESGALAVGGQVSVVSFVPEIWSSTELRFTVAAVAVKTSTLLNYLSTLSDDPHVTDLRLMSLKSEGGTGAMRIVFSLDLKPDSYSTFVHSSPASQSEPLALPNEARYFEDLGRIFSLANHLGVALTDIDFGTRQEPTAVLSPEKVVQVVTFSAQTEYERFNKLLAEWVESIPQLTIRSLKLERDNSNAKLGRISCELEMVYAVATHPIAMSGYRSAQTGANPFAPLASQVELQSPGVPVAVIESMAPEVAPAIGLPAVLPFSYIGSIQAESRTSQRPQVFLQSGGTVFTVNVGDMVDGSYRLVAVSREQVELMHLPSGTARYMSIKR